LSIHELVARNADAVCAYEAGRDEDAIVLFTQTLAGCHAILGSDHLGTLTVAGNLAVACVAGGQLCKGVELLRANLAARVRILGGEDPRTLTARDALAVALRMSGNHHDAVALSGEVAEQRRRTLGPTHPDTLTSQMGLALAIEAATGDVERAMTILTAAINAAQQVYGPNHTLTAVLTDCRGALALQA
jgi:hypothetical protein